MQEQYIVDFTLAVSLRTRQLAALCTPFLAFQAPGSLALENDIELRCGARPNKHRNPQRTSVTRLLHGYSLIAAILLRILTQTVAYHVQSILLLLADLSSRRLPTWTKRLLALNSFLVEHTTLKVQRLYG